MSKRSSVGQGRYVAGEWDVFVAPYEAWANPGAYPGVIRCGGHGTSALTMYNHGAPGFAFTNALGEAFPTLIPDLGGGTTWGNDLCITRMGEAKTYLQGTRGAKAGKVMIATGSMGVLTALNWARANLSSVAAVVGTIPALDLTDIHANNRGGFAAEINAAYGGTYVPATHEATHSPLAFASSLTFPMKFWYAASDTICLPAKAEAFAAAAPDVELVSMAGGHFDAVYPATLNEDVVAFLTANAP